MIFCYRDIQPYFQALTYIRDRRNQAGTVTLLPKSEAALGLESLDHFICLYPDDLVTVPGQPFKTGECIGKHNRITVPAFSRRQEERRSCTADTRVLIPKTVDYGRKAAFFYHSFGIPFRIPRARKKGLDCSEANIIIFI
jgi:hypothetical protein